MPDAQPKRPALTTIAALCGLLAMAACQSMLPGGTGASATAASRIAAIRSSQGLPALRADAQLERAALRQSGYMASSGRMTHRTGFGRDFSSRMRSDGIEGPAAENIANGGMELDKVFEMWMNSRGHRRNMLDPRFSRYGLASAKDEAGRKYWTLVLAK